MRKKFKAKTLKTAQDQLGDFYHLVAERQQFEQIMTALYHKIENHTPTFQLPAQQLLDDLIEGYGYSDAAQHLLQVRHKIQDAVKNQEVAHCAFVDEQSRLAAVTLLTQAFNSKADFYFAESLCGCIWTRKNSRLLFETSRGRIKVCRFAVGI